jgi:hypothetical protein
MEQAFIIESIGVSAKGDSVIRIRANLRPGSEFSTSIEVSTNMVGFARLAAAGVRVYNEQQRKPR